VHQYIKKRRGKEPQNVTDKRACNPPYKHTQELSLSDTTGTPDQAKTCVCMRTFTIPNLCMPLKC